MMKQHSKDQGIIKRMSSLRMLWDIEARVRMLDEQLPDVQQVLTCRCPPRADRRAGSRAGTGPHRQR